MLCFFVVCTHFTVTILGSAFVCNVHICNAFVCVCKWVLVWLHVCVDGEFVLLADIVVPVNRTTEEKYRERQLQLHVRAIRERKRAVLLLPPLSSYHGGQHRKHELYSKYERVNGPGGSMRTSSVC